MRNLTEPEIDRYRVNERRVIELYGSAGDRNNGVFRLPSLDGERPMLCIVSVGMGWDHVSVSVRGRCPTWAEMEHVKRLFFKPTETAMQLHVPESEHINHDSYTLHLWRPKGTRKIPRPPHLMVAPKPGETLPHWSEVKSQAKGG